MTAADRDAAFREARAETSIQHRCPRMGEHLQGGCRCHPTLPIPCADCYSVRVTSERLPYQPSQQWAEVSPVGGAQ